MYSKGNIKGDFLPKWDFKGVFNVQDSYFQKGIQTELKLIFNQELDIEVNMNLLSLFLALKKQLITCTVCLSLSSS